MEQQHIDIAYRIDVMTYTELYDKQVPSNKYMYMYNYVCISWEWING